MPTQTTVPPKPRLRKNETPQSPAFQKRMKEWQRAVALAEATAAKKEQDEREAKERAKRDVLKEAEGSSKPSKPAKPSKPSTDKPADKPVTGIASSGRNALRNRARTIEEAIEGGIQEADEDSKRKRKK